MANRKVVARPYELRISRLTVDKLGVKLYDKASAVVAELVANSYDADAEAVAVKIPLATLLARKNGKGQVKDLDYMIEVVDDGHGMTPDEVIDEYLKVGRDRRKAKTGGGLSRIKKRPVMGRKGIGKLAPFGICERIEVITAGGSKTSKGFLTAHFYIDYADLLKDTDEVIRLTPGPRDRKYQAKPGTTIRLSKFQPKRIPDKEVFLRQLAARFVFARADFKIYVQDTRLQEKQPRFQVKAIDVPIVIGTKIDLSARPVETEDGTSMPVKGWLAMAKNPYKNEETAGVRIYARNKIVATTRDFEQPAGFTGEFTVRSYLVGEIIADWLDLDEGDDLIRSDRQSILWDSDYGRALREWGSSLIKEIGKLSKEPRRQRVRDMFLRISGIEEKARARFEDIEVAETAIKLARQIGAFAAEDELEDEDYVHDLSEIILSVAPHKALMEAFQRFGKEIDQGREPKLESIVELFGKTRIAELASYAQLAAERVRVLKQLQDLVLKESDESELQKLITEAPWLVDFTWSVMTKNQALKTFKILFEEFFEERTNKKVKLAIEFEDKRPDFTLVSLGHKLHIIEIKAPKHQLTDEDTKRLMNYVEAFDEFFQNHREVQAEFPEKYQIDLIVDGKKIKEAVNRQALYAVEESGRVRTTNWKDFLMRAKKGHEQFLEVHEKAKMKSKEKKK